MESLLLERGVTTPAKALGPLAWLENEGGEGVCEMAKVSAESFASASGRAGAISKSLTRLAITHKGSRRS